MLQYEGILLCRKPYGMTSHDIIYELRKTIGQKKIGHTGTLDPRATGLLVICLGRATKIAQFLIETDKTYEAEILLGQRSPTMDSEGLDPNEPGQPVPDMNELQMQEVLDTFKGRIVQQVPAYSAVKVGGQRMYKMARKGVAVEAPEREVEIGNITLKKLDLPTVRFVVSCSKGTYVRALADAIGQRIGCGAYLKGLIRTRVGRFELADSLSLSEIKHYRDAGSLKRHVIPIETVLPFPSIQVNKTFSQVIISGRSPELKDIVDISGDFNAEDLISLRDHTGRVMAVGRAEVDSAQLHSDYKGKQFFTYIRVLN